MALAFRTGVKKTVPCYLCGALVNHEESKAYTAEGEVQGWFMDTHQAPCGAQCFGGGAKGSEGIALYKAGKLHGIKGKPCEACKEKPAGEGICGEKATVTKRCLLPTGHSGAHDEDP